MKSDCIFGVYIYELLYFQIFHASALSSAELSHFSICATRAISGTSGSTTLKIREDIAKWFQIQYTLANPNPR